MEQKLFLFIFTVTVLTTVGNTLKKCNRSDEKLEECLTTAIEDTLKNSPVKKLGLPTLDPLEVRSFVVAPGKNVVNFEQKYRDVKIKGLAQTKCTKAEINFEVGSISLDCGVPSLSFEFQYEINGNILMLPISGKGPGYMNLEHLNLHVILKLEKHQKNGKEHYKVTTSSAKLSPQKIQFRLNNLFNGDKTLGENINKILNDNWLEIFNDVKSSYEDALAEILSDVTNKVLGKLPISELFDEK